MNSARRHRYLRALGVEVWVRRDREPAAIEADVAEAEAEAITPADAAESPRLAGPPSPRSRAPSARESPPIAPIARIAEPPPSPFVPPADWAGLRAAVAGCRRCKLCATRTQTVFGVGDEHSPVMVVGEGPGADEDAQGEPFVGRAGKLLDEMLAAIGRSRRASGPVGAVYIANVVKCRPPGNRDPETDEVEACRPYLEQQIRLIRPRLILGLGRIAAQRLLSSNAPLSRLRGPMYRYGPEATPLFVSYHPAYLLRSPREKAKSWDDLKKVWRFLAADA